jgi:hypothetical protein
MATDGRLTFVPFGFGGRPSTADFGGVVHLGSDPGATNFRGIIDPLNLELLESVRPGLAVPGDARLQVEASGRVEEGIRFTADITHAEGSPTESRVLLGGSVFRSEQERWITDVQGDFSPLSLRLFAGLSPALGLQGTLSGFARGVGPLDDLRITGALSAGSGTMAVEGDLDIRSPGSAYRLDVRLRDVLLSDLSSRLPTLSEWTGRLELDGRGLDAESLSGRARLSAAASRVGGLHVDTVAAAVSAAGGVLSLDTLDAMLGGVHVVGAGELSMVEGESGTARLTFSTPTLFGLRPLFRGDSVLARDELSPLDEHWLSLEGVDVDTLPVSEEVAMQGAAEGYVEATGSFGALDVSGRV